MLANPLDPPSAPIASRAHRRPLVSWLALGAVFVGCASGENSVSPPAAVSVSLDTKNVWAPPGTPITVSALATDENGVLVATAPITWSVADGSVAKVVTLPGPAGSATSSAVVEGLKWGVATTVVATLANGAKGTAIVNTVPRVVAYDVTTRFSTFSWETGIGYPDCPSSGLYCTHVRPYAGGNLQGTLSYDRESSTTSGVLGGSFCSAWSVDAPTGCTAVTAIQPESYTLYSPLQTGAQPFTASMKGPGEFGRLVGFQNVVTTPDSTYGRIYWQASIGRSPPTHSGMFVARERR